MRRRTRLVGSVLLLGAFLHPELASAQSPYGDLPTVDTDSPPPAGKGLVTGKVLDKDTKEPVFEARVDVIGRDEFAVTDLDGNYRLELPPGTYTLRYWSDIHLPIRATRVVVFAGGTRTLDVPLVADNKVVEEYVIEAKPASGSVDALALERKRSAAVGDAVGRAEISKTPDRDAAQAARRVVGATIEDGRFVYVRGLGERYTNALLNGAPLPSPEPDRAAVPLDLFPTQILETLTIAKTFTPDVPGDFAGGSVRVHTRSVPDEFLFSSSLSFGFNTQTTFKERLSHRGGSLDFLGIDDGTRALPDNIPGDYKLASAAKRPNGDLVLPNELVQPGRELNTYMTPTRAFTPPDMSASIVAGDGIKLGAEQKLGYLAALNYRRAFKIRTETYNIWQPINQAAEITPYSEFERELGVEDVSWGAFGSLAYELNRNHRFTLQGFRSHLADKDTQVIDGSLTNEGSDLHAIRQRFVTRSLNVVQLHGDHKLPEASDAEVSWHAGYSVAQRDEPDTRDVGYVRDQRSADAQFSYADRSAQHFFSDQSEVAKTIGLDWRQPLQSGTNSTAIKLGGLLSLKDREFRARRFIFRRNSPATTFVCPGTEYSDDCVDSQFLPENIGSSGPGPLFQLEETTQGEDAYDASLNVYGAYLMADLALAKPVRAIVGQRLEVTRQKLQSFDQFGEDIEIEGTDLEETDMLPALALVFNLTEKSKLRTSITRTLARPQLRELAPFAYVDFYGGELTSGNPNLVMTHITNFDMRFEHFPKLSEVLAFSFFYKAFEDPIEPVLRPSGGDGNLKTFQNSNAASLIGTELEARIDLDRLTEALNHFSVVSNLTLARSQVKLEDTDTDFLTSLSRPMANQAPYVWNFAIDYSNDDIGFDSRVLYNVIGKRLVGVGDNGLPDTYEKEWHQLDFVAQKSLGDHFKLKFAATNLIDGTRLRTIGKSGNEDNVVRKYKEGRSFSVGATYTY